MFYKLDDFIIDSLCQPIIDRYAIHPVDLAENALVCYGVMMLTAILYLILSVMVPFFVIMGIVVIAIQCCGLYQHYKCLKILRQILKPGCLNPLRLLVSTRTISLFGLIGLCVVTWAALPFTVFSVLFEFALIVDILTNYIQACNLPAPSKPQQSRYDGTAMA